MNNEESQSYVQKIALYPGTFDAPTNGHLDIINRASRLFDKVIVGIAHNMDKTPLFTPEERVEMIIEVTKHLSNIEVVHFAGLTVDFAKKVKAKFIIRGLRAISDFEFELQMALINRELNSNIETIFLAPATDYIFLSSRSVKELLKFKGNISNLVPPFIEKKMVEKFEKQNLFG